MEDELPAVMEDSAGAIMGNLLKRMPWSTGKLRQGGKERIEEVQVEAAKS